MEQRQHRRLIGRLHALSKAIARTKTRIREILFVAKLTIKCSDIGSRKALQVLESVYKPKLPADEQLYLQQLIDELRLPSAISGAIRHNLLQFRRTL